MAESGAQTIHGMDIVKDEAGLAYHPRGETGFHNYLIDDNEVARRCEQWLSAVNRLVGD